MCSTNPISYGYWWSLYLLFETAAKTNISCRVDIQVNMIQNIWLENAFFKIHAFS